ncbi:LOB domain-containing protein 29 isoform X1 [Sorghum bicolor]|uniref:LOB domain-containing protein 29 isoform X1 n=1 Tax=Sorghum bicolor TaxID=4558 RepID=UPI000B423C76|nr:LOB domain-containing protein 29 isoform X1 [Sorghum bicolor]|eukprot:XP_021315946.1 LOB domain-containing protein 29 isoform X1 [Sorghum bicolor]
MAGAAAAAAANGGTTAAAAAATGAGSPCGACKFLRRRCVPECVFAPYFSSDQGAARFAAIHKVFGASNASKLLSHLPVADRCEAVVTITYEAQARLRDPVYGCVAQIFALQQQAGRHPASAADAGQGAARVRRPRRRALAGEPPVARQRQHQRPAPPGHGVQRQETRSPRRLLHAGAHGRVQGRRRRGRAALCRQGGCRRAPVPGPGHDEEPQLLPVAAC